MNDDFAKRAGSKHAPYDDFTALGYVYVIEGSNGILGTIFATRRDAERYRDMLALPPWNEGGQVVSRSVLKYTEK